MVHDVGCAGLGFHGLDPDILPKVDRDAEVLIRDNAFPRHIEDLFHGKDVIGLTDSPKIGPRLSFRILLGLPARHSIFNPSQECRFVLL